MAIGDCQLVQMSTTLKHNFRQGDHYFIKDRDDLRRGNQQVPSQYILAEELIPVQLVIPLSPRAHFLPGVDPCNKVYFNVFRQLAAREKSARDGDAPGFSRKVQDHRLEQIVRNPMVPHCIGADLFCLLWNSYYLYLNAGVFEAYFFGKVRLNILDVDLKSKISRFEQLARDINYCSGVEFQ